MIREAIMLYSKAIAIATMNNQCVGEKNEYFVTIAQLEELLKPVEYPSSPQVKSPICANCGHDQDMHDGGKYCCFRPSDTIPQWMCNCTTFVGSEGEPRTSSSPQVTRQREHNVNPDTDRCVMCSANRFQRTRFPNCTFVGSEVKPRTGDKS